MASKLIHLITEKFLIWALTAVQLWLMRKHPHQRGQHPKQHGCVWAEFEIALNVPDDMRIGVFGEPRTFEALIRFSNGSVTDDRKPDVHGMAIKLLGVPGRKLLKDEQTATTQDFVMEDHPVFFARNVWHLMRFAMLSRADKQNGTVYRKYPAFRGFLHHAKSNPLANKYWSQTPYMLGETVVRYSVRPDAGNATADEERSSPNFLRQAMVKRLASGNSVARFSFYVQRAPNASPKWMNDPTMVWDEVASPPVRVANVTISPQDFATKMQDQYGDHLAFTPWHSLPVHEPVGQVNRARRIVYRASEKKRGADKQEPQIGDRPQSQIEAS